MCQKVSGECVGIQYIKQKQEVVRSFSKKDPGRIQRQFPEATIYEPGNGWAYVTIPARLILMVRLKNAVYEVSIECLIRKHWGRITKKRRQILQETMPGEIKVSNGEIENTIVLDTDEFLAWLDEAKKKSSK